MLRKYDSFFYFLSTVMFFSSFLCIIFINIPSEIKQTENLNLSERLNNLYLYSNYRTWKFENGLFMLFTGIGMIGIIWLTDLDIKVEWLYVELKKHIKRFTYSKHI